MKRSIQSSEGDVIAPLERMTPAPDTVRFPLASAVNRCEVTAAVRTGDAVSAGTVLASGTDVVIHASLSGIVERVDSGEVVLRHEASEGPLSFPTAPHPAVTDLRAFARDMGLVGMGGSMFPASIKLKAAERIHTLVINAVECEPGIQIDEALLLHDLDIVRVGWDWLVETLRVERTVLAAKRTSASRLKSVAVACKADILRLPNVYPGGAEKLIIARLDRRMPPTGLLPVRLGYLVFSVASLWAVGRRLLTGEPSILRPLTVAAAPHVRRNLLVPVGTPVGHVLKASGIRYDPGQHLIVAGGLMMGRRVDEGASVLKGTNAIFVQPIAKRLTRTEEPCILCGACFDVCPLKLHPSGMADRILEKRRSDALTAQIEECFLCGACSAVCPSGIPLVQTFHEGKAWLREQP